MHDAGACCLLMTWRPSVTLQAIARAGVWAILLPNVHVTLLLASMGHAPHLRMIVQMALAIGALVVTRPFLSTERAREEFAPVALRPWFLASAIGAMASGIALARLAAAFAHFPVLVHEAVGLGALAVPLIVAGFGVVRMRAWGVVLGALVALASIPIVLLMHDSLLTLPVLLACAPAALMPALVVAARARVVTGVRHRVAPQLRVAVEDSATMAQWDHEEEPAMTCAAR
jgi:hypothetical protein